MTPRQRFAALPLALRLLSLSIAPCILRAQTPPPTTTPVQHLVVIFQENVSFDHYFATYPVAANNNPSAEPSFTALPSTPSVNGLSGPLLTTNPNSAQPFRLTRAQAVTCDQDHNYADEQKAFNGGLMNKFVESVGSSSSSCDINGLGKTIVMGYYDGNTTTAIWNYAQNYAMSDNSFGTTFGPSAPGAINLVSGQTHGAVLTAGSAAGNVGSGGSVVGDPRPDPSLDDCTLAPPRAYIMMTGKNVGDLLNAKGITWGWFQGGFRPTSTTGSGTAVCGAHHVGLAGDDAVTTSGDYIPHHEPFQYYKQSNNLHHLPPTSVANIGKTDQANHQYDLSDFTAALAAGNLPAVTYLKTAAYQDGHAGYSSPVDEQTFLVNTINALMQSPFWASTAIVIAYDDSDGWYDHVMGPIVNQSATSDDNLSGPGLCGSGSVSPYQSRCGYGPRLPLMVISPFAKVNFVDHTVTDQSSILKFVEDNWSLGRIGGNSADAYAGSLLNMFKFTNPPARAVILDPTTGLVAANPNTIVTQAVANPKGGFTTWIEAELDGTQSTAANLGNLTYAWTQSPFSKQATITGANTATPIVLLGNGPGTYSFILTVTDSNGNQSSDTASLVLQ
ncbi:MAG TPA: alkaline phosphatase family protein [Bryobacteraceae bacterium]|jgi:phospholipase C|nr:alkaline phosphatase family protein [Bryobacteraceae bacterium]